MGDTLPSEALGPVFYWSFFRRVFHGLHIFAVPVNVVAVFYGDNTSASTCMQASRVALLVRDINDAVPTLGCIGLCYG